MHEENSTLNILNLSNEWVQYSLPFKIYSDCVYLVSEVISDEGCFCFLQFAAKEHQQALDILDMEEPINKRLFEKCLKDESGLKDPSSDWEMSQSSVSNTVRSFNHISKNCPQERANVNHLLLLQYNSLKIVGLPT